jgi:hypothetical protein
MQILFPGPPGPLQQAGWWDHYRGVLASSGIGKESRAVIDADSDYIVERAIFGCGEPGAGWPAGRERSGVVMGAVQSGKTASMMALAAKALDRGVDIVVVLAGTRRSLWLQTFERVLAQLDLPGSAATRRVLLPTKSVVQTDFVGLTGLYGVSVQIARRAFERSRPIIAVVMKHPAHIEQIAKTLHETVYPVAGELGRVCHVVVIDDEADDSSIVDAVLEPDAGDYDKQQKQVPRRILDLWESRHSQGETVAPHVYATYVAYTATPQANFLQDPNNPLAPRDFAVSLRTPGTKGTVTPRSSSYAVDNVGAMYMGGEIYYKSMANAPLCVDTATYSREPGLEQTSVGLDGAAIDALRSYLIASAIRLLRSPNRAGPASAADMTFETRSEAMAGLAKSMSMLVHPAAGMVDHFAIASEIIRWSAGQNEEVSDFTSLADRHLRVDGILEDMDSNPERWTAWLESFRRSAEATLTSLGGAMIPTVPGVADWVTIRSLILEQVVPGTLVAVINSDPSADERPEFEPVLNAEGRWRAARNASTIFVSGNVMSRGLTLEGLTTTLFTRASNAPLADTQMQMQRWFGYRGSYIELCRVFMPGPQIEHFRRYHENDEALRRDVLGAMESAEPGKAPSVTILQGNDFRATGKFSNLRGTSPYPGDKAFFGYTNEPGRDEANIEVLRATLADGIATVESKGSVQAAFSTRNWSMAEVADMLDSLSYTGHGDTVELGRTLRWRSFARAAGIEATASPLYRGPVVADDEYPSTASPYWVGAYLRYWEACLRLNVPGLYTFDDPPTRWDLIDFDSRFAAAPSFKVGVRFGAGPLVTDGPLSDIGCPVRPMLRARKPDAPLVLNGTWGSQNAGDSGRSDQFIDFRLPDVGTDAPEFRVPGSQGMVLFHLIGDEDGRLSVAVGYGLPYGGPDFVEARTRA